MIVRTERTPCMGDMGELPPFPANRWAGPAEGCPETWETCLTGDEAGALEDWVIAVERWTVEVKTACKEKR